jgi:hypothetical protein
MSRYFDLGIKASLGSEMGVPAGEKSGGVLAMGSKAGEYSFRSEKVTGMKPFLPA